MLLQTTLEKWWKFPLGTAGRNENYWLFFLIVLHIDIFTKYHLMTGDVRQGREELRIKLMDDLDKLAWKKLWNERDRLLNHLTNILDGVSAKDISNLTGLSIEHCEKIIDDCYRLNQGKSI